MYLLFWAPKINIFKDRRHFWKCAKRISSFFIPHAHILKTVLNLFYWWTNWYCKSTRSYCSFSFLHRCTIFVARCKTYKCWHHFTTTKLTTVSLASLFVLFCFLKIYIKLCLTAFAGLKLYRWKPWLKHDLFSLSLKKTWSLHAWLKPYSPLHEASLLL